MSTLASVNNGWAGKAALVGLLALATLAVLMPSAQAKPAEDPVVQEHFVCEAVYMPSRAVWTRKVLIEHDEKRMRAVFIDGVKVYTFQVEGSVVYTALDNERIALDLGNQTWSSDFRGLANGRGQCERLRAD